MPLGESGELDPDYGRVAQQAAERHLMACAEALDEEEDDSPAWGPYCGCDTCVVREVIYAAWPIVVRSVTDFLPEDIRQDFHQGRVSRCVALAHYRGPLESSDVNLIHHDVDDVRHGEPSSRAPRR